MARRFSLQTPSTPSTGNSQAMPHEDNQHNGFDTDYARTLLLEPSVFRQYPVAPKNIAFILRLARNIPGIQLCCAEFDALQQLAPDETIIFKEHPLNRHYRGHEDPRDWMFGVEGYFPSFFKFWKLCQKEIASPG